MKKLLTVTVFTVSAVIGLPAQAAQVVQVFACELHNGQTMDNVWALADTIRGVSETLDSPDEGAGAFLWTPFRGATPYDYVIGLINTSLKDVAEGVTSYYSSPVGAATDAQFTATGDCISAIVFSEQIRNGVIGNTGGDRELDAVVETFGCSLNKDADMEDVDEATEFWLEQVPKVGSAALDKYEAYMWTPYRGGTGQSDFTWVGNYPDLATWAQGEMDYHGSKAGQAAEERFVEVTTCNSALWGGYWIVPPAAGPTAE